MEGVEEAPEGGEAVLTSDDMYESEGMWSWEKPKNGDGEWGRWSQDASEIYLELLLNDESIRAKNMDIGIKDGWLTIGTKDSDAAPLLSGRLMQSVLKDDLTWSIDGDDDDKRTLSLNLPKKQHHSGKYLDSVFEDTLQINGGRVVIDGLSHGSYVSAANEL